MYVDGNSTANLETDYATFTTPLLPPGLYDFKWEVFKYGNYYSNLWLDNIDFIN